MTLILGLTVDGQTYLAADSIGSNGHTYSICAQSKIFPQGKLLIGYTSSFRMGQLLEHDLNLPAREEGQALLPYLVRGVVPAVRSCLTEGGFARTSEGVQEGGDFLLAAEGRLFRVQADFAVLENVAGFDAVGSGEAHGLAVLHATRDLGLSPFARLHLALETAAAHVVTVRGPFWVIGPGDAHARPLDKETHDAR